MNESIFHNQEQCFVELKRQVISYSSSSPHLKCEERTSMPNGKHLNVSIEINKR